MTDQYTNQTYSIATGANSTAPFVIHFSSRDPTAQDVNYPVQKQWVNTTSQKFWILSGFSTSNGVITADWLLFPQGSATAETLTGNSGGAVSPDGSSNINVIGDGSTITIAGNPGTNTLTAQLIGAVTSLFTADSGTATPSGGDIILAGGTGLSTSASGHTVTFNAATSVATSYVTDSGTAMPSSNILNVNGDGAAIATSGSGDTITISFSGSSVVETLTGNTGGAIGPSANNINVVGDGSTVSVAGAGHTLTISSMGSVPISFVADSGTATPSAGVLDLFGSGSITTVGSGHQVVTELTGLTNHAVLVGNGSTTITKVGPTATALQVLQSQGSGADPAFSTATYPATTTVNDILYSSSTNVVGQITAANNSALTSSAAGVPSWTSMAADGDLIIGSSAGAPTAATLTAGTGISITNGHNSISIAVTGGILAQVTRQVFTSTQTYTPTAGMVYVDIICLGGGGAGGGCAATNGISYSAGTGGGSGEYAQGIFTAAQIGASKVVTIGAGGTGVNGTTGNAGGNSSVGVLISAFGGGGGTQTGAQTIALQIYGPAGGTGGSGGDFRTPGQYGAFALADINHAASAGLGANSQYGAGGNGTINTTGGAALGYGAGGGGTGNGQSQPAQTGGAGTAGLVICTEYCT